VADLNTDISKTIAVCHIHLIKDHETPYDRKLVLKKFFNPADATRTQGLHGAKRGKISNRPNKSVPELSVEERRTTKYVYMSGSEWSRQEEIGRRLLLYRRSNI
jgi:hypothetical protein